MESILRRGRVLLLALLALAVILPGAVMAQSSEPNGSKGEHPTSKPAAGEDAVPGQIIVKFKEEVGPSAQANIRHDEDLEKKEELGLINAELVKVEGRSVEQALRDLNDRPDVEYAQPNFIAHLTGYADEPLFDQLWGLHNTGQKIEGSTGVSNVDINGLQASAITQGDPKLVVAVLDSGVDFSHPDLAARAWTNPDEIPGNGVDDDNSGFVDDVNGGADFVNNDSDPYDDHGHGTHVSGTIAASVDDQGMVGVAPNVKIMALKIFKANGISPPETTVAKAILALDYAKREGAKISNNSWGCFCDMGPALKDAINASDSLFVAAAGNNGADLDVPDHTFTPAEYDSANILSVAATNNQGNLASFSNFGATSVDISAPGVSIFSAIPAFRSEPAVALSSVGSSGKAVTAGFGAEEIGDVADQASFFTKSFTAVDRGSQPVVLVDDDGSSDGGEANVGPDLSAAIQTATGSAPQVIDVADGHIGPDLSELTGKTVVWATGQEFDSLPVAESTLTATDRMTLTDFLNGGGKLVITGRDAMWKSESYPFVIDDLKLNVVSDVPRNKTKFAGSAGTAFAGEAYDLNSPFATEDGWHDLLTPSSASAVTQGVYPEAALSSWEYLDGTSMATPHATGVAALAASMNPALLSNPVNLKDLVMSTANRKVVPATNDKTVTGGMVDARATAAASDTTPPKVISVTPANNATGIARGANVTATFSEAMRNRTFGTNTFELKKQGASTKVFAHVSYNSATKKAALIPFRDLDSGATYIATVTTGVQDLAGNPLDQSPGATGNQSKTWSFKVRR